jgi:hypothetical protein
LKGKIIFEFVNNYEFSYVDRFLELFEMHKKDLEELYGKFKEDKSFN